MSWSAESRLAEKIRERVANCVLFELQDPRISFITVTRVRLARDMSRCRVFYSVLGTPAERNKTARALKDAAGFVQREVAKILRTRVTPHLEFAYDDAIEGGMRVVSMLDRLKEERGEEPDGEGTGTDADAPVSAVGEEGEEREESDMDDPPDGGEIEPRDDADDGSGSGG